MAFADLLHKGVELPCLHVVKKKKYCGHEKLLL